MTSFYSRIKPLRFDQLKAFKILSKWKLTMLKVRYKGENDNIKKEFVAYVKKSLISRGLGPKKTRTQILDIPE